jgi:muramoyltetrapeptide carboxypeptidase
LISLKKTIYQHPSNTSGPPEGAILEIHGVFQLNKVFIVTPSYLIKKKSDFTGGIKQLSKLGFHVLNPEFPMALPSPQEKADQLHRAFEDPGVDMILALRGGYSSMKSLPYIDFELIRKNPKIIAGFSDLSALLNPIYERTGLVTLHAPMVINLGTPTAFTVKSLLNAVNGYPEKNLLKGARFKVYTPGSAAGILKGGNLITLTALIHTDWDIDTSDSILFLEDVDEKLHQVDRYLTQWILAGKFKCVKGLILGDFRGISSKKVYDILASQMELDFPVVHCPYIGHAANKITLPVGAEVELNTDRKQLVIRKMSFPVGIR